LPLVAFEWPDLTLFLSPVQCKNNQNSGIALFSGLRVIGIRQNFTGKIKEGKFYGDNTICLKLKKSFIFLLVKKIQKNHFIFAFRILCSDFVAHQLYQILMSAQAWEKGLLLVLL
jgi:hypothetical protein